MTKDEKFAVLIGAIFLAVYLLYKGQSTKQEKKKYHKPARVNQFTGASGVDPHDQSPYTVGSIFESNGLSNAIGVTGLALLV